MERDTPFAALNGCHYVAWVHTNRAINVVCISFTASSTEVPQPSFRISTPKIFMLAAAPYSLHPARVMSKGRIWSEAQGWPGL